MAEQETSSGNPIELLDFNENKRSLVSDFSPDYEVAIANLCAYWLQRRSTTHGVIKRWTKWSMFSTSIAEFPLYISDCRIKVGYLDAIIQGISDTNRDVDNVDLLIDEPVHAKPIASYLTHLTITGISRGKPSSLIDADIEIEFSNE